MHIKIRVLLISFVNCNLLIRFVEDFLRRFIVIIINIAWIITTVLVIFLTIEHYFIHFHSPNTNSKSNSCRNFDMRRLHWHLLTTIRNSRLFRPLVWCRLWLYNEAPNLSARGFNLEKCIAEIQDSRMLESGDGSWEFEFGTIFSRYSYCN